MREALIERETLWAMAPHLVRPLRFILPYHKGLRPAWLLRLGLFFMTISEDDIDFPPRSPFDLDVGDIWRASESWRVLARFRVFRLLCR